MQGTIIVFAEDARRTLRNLMRKKRGLRLTAPWYEILKTLVNGSVSAHVNRKTHTYKLYY